MAKKKAKILTVEKGVAQSPLFRVVLVEDNPADVRLIQILLKGDRVNDYDVFAATTLATAMEHMAKNSPDIILLDLSLPDAFGLDTITRVKAYQHDVPVVVLTGSDDEEMSVAAVHAGCQDYLVKGQFDENTLHRVITYAIERQKSELALEVARQEADEANQAKTEFLSSFSHRLRTPLNTVLGLAEMIQSGAVGPCENEKIMDYVNDIAESGRDMHNLTNEIMEVSQAEAALKSKDQTYRQLVDMSPDCVCVIEGGKIVMINGTGASLFGFFSAEELEGRDINDLVHVDYQHLLENNCEVMVEEGVAVPFKFRHATGRDVDVMVSTVPFVKKDNSILLVARDITSIIESTKEVVRQNRRLNSILDTVVDAIIVTDADGIMETFNESARNMFGYTEAEALGENVAILLPEEVRDGHDNLISNFAAVRTATLGRGRELRGCRKDGTIFPIEISLGEKTLDDRHLFTAVVRDITERKQMEDRLTHQSTHDILTNIPNRALLNDRLAQAINAASRNNQRLAVMFVDLDGFKTINDSLGHEAGDELLKEVAQRMALTLRKSDTVARFGGDEFVVIFPELEDRYNVVELADRFVGILNAPFHIAGREVVVTASIGISNFPNDGDTPVEMIRHADVAMLQAKQMGKNVIRFYDPSMNENAVERLTLEYSLRAIIAKAEKKLAGDDLVLHYQPQWNMKTGEIVGVEALCRWTDPTLGSIPPVKFIPLAEETGLIIPLGKWVLGQAFKDIAALHKDGFEGLRIAVNISPRQFARGNIETLLKTMMDDAGINPSTVEIEITESILMHNPEAVVETLNVIKGLGARLAIDDFGTGFSSLSYLKRFPVDTIKIDQAFVRDIMVSADDRAIVASVIGLAHSMNMCALAEGMEEKAQQDILREEGCDEVQGFMMARPMPIEELKTFMSKLKNNRK